MPYSLPYPRLRNIFQVSIAYSSTSHRTLRPLRIHLLNESFTSLRSASQREDEWCRRLEMPIHSYMDSARPDFAPRTGNLIYSMFLLRVACLNNVIGHTKAFTRITTAPSRRQRRTPLTSGALVAHSHIMRGMQSLPGPP